MSDHELVGRKVRTKLGADVVEGTIERVEQPTGAGHTERERIVEIHVQTRLGNRYGVRRRLSDIKLQD